MNPLLLDDADFMSTDRVVLHDYRLKHLHEVHRTENGDTLWVGRPGGWVGEDRLLKLDASKAILKVRSDQPPPAKLPIILLLTLPRLKMFRRVLQTAAAVGIPKPVLLSSYCVEKSLWQTPSLDPAAIHKNLVLGLEQVHNTVLPEIIVEKRFKPLAENYLPALVVGNLGLVDHPGPWPACPRVVKEPTTLAIGPEGGRIPYEVDRLREAGLHPVQLGEHILRMEAVVSTPLAWSS